MLLNFCLFFFCLLQGVSDKNLEGWKEIFLPLPRTPNSSSIQCLCLWMNCTVEASHSGSWSDPMGMALANEMLVDETH